MTIVDPLHQPQRWRRGTTTQLTNRQNTQGRKPSIPHPVSPASSGPGVFGWWDSRYSAVTGGFVDTWVAAVPVLARQAIFAHAPLLTAAASTASIRLRITNSVGTQLAVSGSYVQGVSLNLPRKFEWLHGLDLWTTTDVIIAFQIDVTSASVPSPVDFFLPYGGAIAQRTPVHATATGILP